MFLSFLCSHHGTQWPWCDVRLLVLVHLLLALSPASESCWGKTAPRYGDMTGDYELLVGKDLVLNCTLNSHQAPSDIETYYVNSTHLLFKKNGNQLSSNLVQLLDGLTAQLRIPNATLQDSGTFYCHLDIPAQPLVCASKVSVGYPPKPARNFSCISKYYENLTCTWDVEDSGIQTKYTLYKHLFAINSHFPDMQQLCPGETPSNLTYCQWREDTDPPYDINEKNFTFILRGNNSLGTSNDTFSINLYEILIPNNPQNLFVVKVAKQNITLKWYPPQKMDQVTKPPLLQYQMWLQEMNLENQEPGEKRVIDVGVDTYEYTVTDLIPYMDYNISLRCRSKFAVGNDMWGPLISIKNLARTLPDVPYFVPDIIPEAFELRHYNGYRTATLYWKPVAKKYFNGQDFRYHIVYFQNNSTDKAVRVTNSVNNNTLYASSEHLQENEAYTFQIYSSNKEGLSSAYNTIVVDPQENIPQLPQDITAISHNPGHYELSWKQSEKNRIPIVDYIVFWCSNLKPWLSRCEGPIQWIKDPIRENKAVLSLSDNKANFQFAVVARTTEVSSGMQWATCIVPYKAALGKIAYLIVEQKNSTSLKVIWRLDCAAQKAVVKKFEIVYCKSNDKKQCLEKKESVEVMEPASESYVLHDLHPFSKYRVIIRAYNLAGLASEDSDPQFQNTSQGAPSDPPKVVEVIATPNASFHITWHPPLQPNGIVTQYHLLYNGNLETIQVKDQKGPYKKQIYDLSHYTNYSLQLEACVDRSCSPMSPAVFIQTDVGVPGVLDPPRVGVINSTFVNVSWNHPSQANGPINFYEIQWIEEAHEVSSGRKLQSLPEEPTRKVIQKGYSTLVELSCSKDEGVKYLFYIRAANIKNDQILYGPLSDATQARACIMSQAVAMIIGAAIGGTLALALVMLLIYKLIKWMSEKIHQVKSITVRLPKGLDGPENNPLNNYENFKNGLVQQSLTNKGLGRLSYIMDDSDNKNRHGSGSSQYSTSSTDELLYRNGKCTKFGRKPSGESSGCSSMSSNVTRMHLSSDSGTESDFMTSPFPDAVFVEQNGHKPPLPILMEAQDPNPTPDAVPTTAVDLEYLKQLEKYKNLMNGVVLKIDQPYSKFGISGNSSSMPPWWMNPLAFYSCNLSNSEPSVIDVEQSEKVYMPYSKIGLAKSSGDLYSLPTTNSDMGYSKFGILPNVDGMDLHDLDALNNREVYMPEMKLSTVGMMMLSKEPNKTDENDCDNIKKLVENHLREEFSPKPGVNVGNKFSPDILNMSPYISINRFTKGNKWNEISSYNDENGYIKFGISARNPLILGHGYVPFNKLNGFSKDLNGLPHPQNARVMDMPPQNLESPDEEHEDFCTADYKVQSREKTPVNYCAGLETDGSVNFDHDFPENTLMDDLPCFAHAVDNSLVNQGARDTNVSHLLNNTNSDNSEESARLDDNFIERMSNFNPSVCHPSDACVAETFSNAEHMSTPNSNCVDNCSCDQGNARFTVLVDNDASDIVQDEAPKLNTSVSSETSATNSFHNEVDSSIRESDCALKYEIPNETFQSSMTQRNGYVPFVALTNVSSETTTGVPNVKETVKPVRKNITDAKFGILPLEKGPIDVSSTVPITLSDVNDFKVPQTVTAGSSCASRYKVYPAILSIPKLSVNGYDQNDFCPKVHRLTNRPPENVSQDYLVKFAPKVESEICEV